MVDQKTMQEFVSICKPGKHLLVKIYETAEDGCGSSHVVRWCEICGSIAVDVDVDGRTNAGQIMKMRRPQVLLRDST